MKNGFRVAAIALSVFSGGCAIHPLPEDVTGVSTYAIVRQIRCEAREAIVRSAIGWLTNDVDVDPRSRAIGFEFANKTRHIQTLSPELFRGRVQLLFGLFYDTGIAYDYDLEMTEVTNLGGSINLLKPFIDGKGSLGLSASADRSRQNTRKFTVTDTFRGLVKDTPPKFCEDQLADPNYSYPIAGKIGMERVIQDFIRLTLYGALSGTGHQGPPTLVDALDFQTFISGSATPTIEFAPLGEALRVANATLTGTASRRDVHKLTVGLAIASAAIGFIDPARMSLFGTGPVVRSARGAGTTALIASSSLFGPQVIASPRTASEFAAVAAVNQVLTTKLARQRFTIIAP
jgi:hypothetical protein